MKTFLILTEVTQYRQPETERAGGKCRLGTSKFALTLLVMPAEEAQVTVAPLLSLRGGVSNWH